MFPVPPASAVQPALPGVELVGEATVPLKVVPNAFVVLGVIPASMVASALAVTYRNQPRCAGGSYFPLPSLLPGLFSLEGPSPHFDNDVDNIGLDARGGCMPAKFSCDVALRDDEAGPSPASFRRRPRNLALSGPALRAARLAAVVVLDVLAAAVGLACHVSPLLGRLRR